MTNNRSTIRRPISPHLTIYRPQISSMLSIAHRLSGGFLFIGIILFCWWLVMITFYPSNLSMFADYSQLAKPILFIWVIAFYYHLLNGIRHLFWDAGLGFEIKTMNISGILVIITSISLTIISWLLT